MKKIRCAIYTRKSAEEGLEQEFNSLDAQREACAAYVASQKAEGWVLLPTVYEDAGLSGGTLERPGLQRLLADIDAGLVDGASAIKCCYAAAGSGTGAEETGLRAPVSRKTSIRAHKGIVVAKKMSRKVSRRVVRPACIAGVRISRPNFRAPCRSRRAGLEFVCVFGHDAHEYFDLTP